MFQLPYSFAGRPIVGTWSPWPMLLLCVYAVYLFCALTVPLVGKVAAGLLLLMGLFGMYRLKGNLYVLSVAENSTNSQYGLLKAHIRYFLSGLVLPASRSASFFVHEMRCRPIPAFA